MKKLLLIGSIFTLILALSIFAVADIQDCEVVNDTGYDIIYLYVSPDYSDDWEEDVLGNEIIPAGDSFEVSFSGYGDHCYFDFKAIDEDGDEYYKWDVDLCSEYYIIFTLADIE